MLLNKDRREQKLDDLFRSSPNIAYKDHIKTLTPWMQAYSELGLFATGPSTRAEINRVADSRKPYIAKHLAVMDEIIKKGPGV